MNRKRTLLLCGLAASMLALSVVGATAVWSSAPAAAPAMMRTVFTWTGGHPPNNLWDAAANWDVGFGYPDGTDDDAVIPHDESSEGQPWAIHMVNVTIRDLDIATSTNFSQEQSTLDVNGVLTIDSGDGNEVIVTWASGKLVTSN